MKNITKQSRPYETIRQNIIDLIYTLKSFTAQELLSKTVNIEGDEKIKEDIVQDLLCHYRSFDLIMDEGRFYPQKKQTMWSAKEVEDKVRQAKLEAIEGFWKKLSKFIIRTVCFTDENGEKELLHFGDNLAKEMASESEPKSTEEMYSMFRKEYNQIVAEKLYFMFRKEIDQYSTPLIVKEGLQCVEFVTVDGNIVGMCGGWYGYIDVVYILPEYRRQGLAKKVVLDWYGRYGRGDYPTRLHIINNNVPAINFWNSLFELKEIECNAVDTLYEIVSVKD